MTTRLRAALAAGAVTLIAAAGCGQAGTNQAGTDQGGATNAGTAGATGNASGGGGGHSPKCSLVPAALVNSALGLSVTEPTETVNSTVTVCRYAMAQGSGTVTVRFQTDETAAGFATGRSGFESNGEPTTDIPGFFDQAYSSTLGSGDLIVNSVVARKGSVEVMVVSRASMDKEKDLITKIFAALG